MHRLAQPQLFLFVIGMLLSTSQASAVSDYYQILRVPASASPHDIQHAYHKIIRKHNPLISSDDPTEMQIFADATAAYQTLYNAKKRHNYDLAIQSGLLRLNPPMTFDPQAGWTVDFDFKSAADQILNKLAEQKDKSILEQIQLTLQLLQQKVDLPSSLYSNQTALKQRAEVAHEIWFKVGKPQSQWPLQALEAASQASFLFIKKFREIDLQLFEHYWALGRASITAFELTHNAMGRHEHSAIMVRILDFARQYEKLEWPPNCTDLLAEVEQLP